MGLRLIRGGEGPRWPAAIIALLVIALVTAGWAMRTRIPLLHNLEGQVIDFQHRVRGTLAPGTEHPISVLLVDDRSVEELGRLPIHRDLVARAIDRLKADGARLIVFDMLFADPARYEAGEDATLAEAIRRAGNVVLPFALVGHGSSPADLALPDTVLANAYGRYRGEARRELIPLKPARLVAPLPRFAESALAMGNVSVQPGHDGSLRFDQPVLWFDDDFFPTLAVRVAALIGGIDWARVEVSVGDRIDIGARALPLDVVSRQWVNYYGPEGTFPTHSFADYVAGRLDPESFRGRIVLIGGSALGTSDRYPSPFDATLPGVERVATVIDNLLTERWLSRPQWAAPVEIGGIILLPLLAVALIRRRRPLPALLILSLVGFAILGIAQLLFVLRHEFISMAFPMAAHLLASGFGIAQRARSDELSRREAEAQLKASELRYALAARGANDGLWDWDLTSDEVFYSPRWLELMGIDDFDAPHLTRIDDWIARLDQLERESFRRELGSHLAGNTQQFNHLFRYDRGSDERWLLARGVAVREHGRPMRLAGSITDMTEQRRLEQRIAFDALHDRLTGLANRELFGDRVDQLLAKRSGEERADAGLVMVDLDGFIAVEEKYGQLGCNALLLEYSRRLRECAGDGPLVAHLGGDQFALGYGGAENRPLAERVARLLDRPCDIDGHAEHVTATIATAHSSQGLESAAELLSAASLALSNGKRGGRGRIHAFDPATQALEHSRRWLDENIDRALATSQFRLFYQPFVRLADRQLVGFEALIRWQHPERGLIMPGDFIPFAEQSGQINDVGRWTMREAARQLVAWDALGFDGEIAVNLSGRQFAETDLEADARELLAILGDVAPFRLKLEVTESMSMANPQRTTEILQRLAALGFKISIDDFGTGYSSLAYLHRFPFNTLKIDRSFVIRLASGREAQEIVRTIAGLANTLGKQVLAEGVEDEMQARTLEELGTEIGQGWLFARALPVERAQQWFGIDEALRPAA